MKISIRMGKMVALYIDTKNNNKILLSVIDNNIFQEIKKSSYIKIIQTKINGNVKLENFISITDSIISSSLSKVHIKSFCSIAPNVSIIGHLHNYNRITSYYIFSNVFKVKPNNDIITKGDIVIEEDVWIGAGAVILSGVTLGRGSIIGANSVCNKSVNKYSIVGGVPVKYIRKRFSEEKIEEIEESKWWTWNEEKIKKNNEMFKGIL